MAEGEILGPNDEVSISTINNTAMDAATRSEITMQVEFAMQHPRSITAVRKELEELVTLDQSIAEESFYTLKRKDKDGNVKLIQGPSVRFAEVLVYCWGHTRSGIQIADVGSEFVVGQGVLFDLQRNNVTSIKTNRRITDKTGRRFNTDMIQTTGNAAASLAYRNAVTRVIPKALWNDILEKAKLTAIGKNKSIGETRNIAIEYGKKIGVTEEQIFTTLGVQGINDLGIDELIALKGLYNAVKEGESTIEEAFGDPFEKEITALMEQAQWPKPKREMVVKDYRGRSLDLLARLRKEVEPLNVGQTQTAKGEGQATPADQTGGDFIRNNEEQKTETKPEATEQTKKAGRPKKDTPVVEAAKEPEPEQKVEEKAEVKEDPKPEPKQEQTKAKAVEQPSDDLFSKF